MPRTGEAKPLIAITTGEPAGIGPDLALMLAARPAARRGARLVLVGDLGLLTPARGAPGAAAAPARGCRHRARRGHRRGCMCRWRAPSGRVGSTRAMQPPYGHPGRRRSRDAFSGEFAAMVTAPVHKGVINEAGYPFTGHTDTWRKRPTLRAW